MKSGYQSELQMLSQKLETPKNALEAFYARRLEDQAIEDSPDLMSEFQGLLAKADEIINEFTHAMKPIRNAVVP